MTCLDVVVVAFNSADALTRSLPQVAMIEGLSRVIVVDNGDDGSASVAANLGAQAIRLEGNPGFGTGQNRGVAVSDALWVLLLNPDAEPIPGAIEMGMGYLDAHPAVAAVQGSIVNRTTGVAERSQGDELGPIHLLGRALSLRGLANRPLVRHLARRSGVLRDYVDRVPERDLEVTSLAATALLVRREAFMSVGGFDERFFLYGEDLDLCRRLRASGWKLVGLPFAWAIHTSGGSFGSRFDRERVWWQGTLQFAARWWSTSAWMLGLSCGLIAWARLAAMKPSRAGEAWHDVVMTACHERRRRGLGDVQHPFERDVRPL